MAVSEWLQIDGEEYQVAIVDMQRKGDVLDLTANRTEDGVLHREVIGTYYNYTLSLYTPDRVLYEKLWKKLTEPVASHQVQLPYQTAPFTGYFGSCKDTIIKVDSSGYKAKGLSCNLVASEPSRTASPEEDT